MSEDTAPDPAATLEGWRKIEQAATPGPWWSDESDECWRLHGVAFTTPPFLNTDGSVFLPGQVVNKQIAKAPKHGTPYAEYWPTAADSAFITEARTAFPRLVAALEAVLKLADEALPVDRDYGGEPIWWNLTPAEIREAITREITGEHAAKAAPPRPVIPWQRDRSIEQAIPTQIAYTAHLGDHLFLLLGDTSETLAGEWTAQFDGRLISDGATDRESATLAAEEKWAEITARMENQ